MANARRHFEVTTRKMRPLLTNDILFETSLRTAHYCHPEMQLKGDTFSKRLVMVNHTHTWWYNMSPLMNRLGWLAAWLDGRSLNL